MSRVRWLVSRLGGLFNRHTRERDLDDELRFHLDEEADEQAAAGMPPAEAARTARRSLGNVALVREDARAVWIWRPVEVLLQDLRYAVRVLRRRPAFTITALLSLALGIGANTAVFGLLKAIQLDTLPVARPDEIVQIAGERGVSIAYPTYVSLGRATRTLSYVFGSIVSPRFDITNEHGSDRVAAELVTSNFFDALGVTARRGRVFHPAPAGAPDELAAVISDDYWRSRFAAAPDVIGSRFRTVRGQEFTIVGVAPPGFRGLFLDEPADLWVSIGASVRRERLDEFRFRVMGRLRPGATAAQAEAEAMSVLGGRVRVTPDARGHLSLRNTLTRPILLLALVAGLVFAIMCTNLANLVLAKTAARDRELSVRRAIGASYGRVVGQLLTESIVLASAGALSGVVIAYWISAALLGFLPPEHARALVNLRFEPDAQVLGFVMLLSFVVCVASGLIPAVRVMRVAPPAALRTSTAGSGRHGTWMSRSLLVGEVAMCTLLLIVAGAFLRTLHNLVSQDAGYDARGLVVADVTWWAFVQTDDDRDRMYDELRARIGALPSVVAAAYSHIGQLDGGGFNYPVRVPGRVMSGNESEAEEARVTPGFLAAMGTALLAGRDVSDGDHLRAPRVAVVNEAFVHHFGMRGDPVGQRFQRTYGSGEHPTIEIVGVVRDAKWATLREAPRPIYYLPYAQSAGRPQVRFVVRGSGDPNALSRSIVQIARAIDPDLRMSNVVPFTDIVSRSLVTERLVAHVSTAFAALGLLIACIGLYGLLAYAVVRRRREIGVRIAIGASPGWVEWMVLRESLVLLAIGVAIGLPAGIAVVRAVSSMLFQLEPGDPVTIAATVATLTVATLAASYLPARRAAGIDPIQALRED